MGLRTLLFCKYGRKVIGIDINDYKSSAYKNFTFIKGNIFKNKIEDKTIDIVLCFDVIEHIENPNSLLQEIGRILKDKGILILSTPNKYRLLAAPLVALRLRKFPFCISNENRHLYPDFWHLREYSEKEIKEFVLKNGFNVINHLKVFYGITGGMGIKNFFGFPFYHNHILVLKKKY